jgi:hypothetical protein
MKKKRSENIIKQRKEEKKYFKPALILHPHQASISFPYYCYCDTTGKGETTFTGKTRAPLGMTSCFFLAIMN